MESKGSLLQKICSGHHNERIALGLCQPTFVKKLDCRLLISCNVLIGSVTHVAEKFVIWASFTSSLKLQIHPRQVPRLRTSNTLLKRRTKPVQQGKNQNPSVSIRGQESHPRSKVPRRLLKANQESLSPFLFWRKLKSLKVLFSLILTSKEVKPEVKTRFSSKQTSRRLLSEVEMGSVTPVTPQIMRAFSIAHWITITTTQKNLAGQLAPLSTTL